MAVEDTSMAASSTSGTMVTPKPSPFLLQHRRRAGPLRAEAEIGADRHMRDAEVSRQYVFAEGLRRQARQILIEAKLVEPLYPDPGQSARPRLGRHQLEGWRVGFEEAAGVWHEGDHAQRCLGQGFMRKRDHMLVAAMHAVKIAKGDRRAPVGCIDGSAVLDDAHGTSQMHSGSRAGWIGRPTPATREILRGGRGASTPGGRGRQSNLAEGASTMASPFSTFLPSTMQAQSSVTRRLA